jgi:hypothetical protein
MMRHIDASKYNTDKSVLSHYLRNYERYFENFIDKEVRLLELGVKDGGSLLLWRDYFEKGLITGLDINQVELNDPSGRIRIYQGKQQDTQLLDQIARETAPDGFDVIIDDCSHIGVLSRISFWHLFDHHLKRGGIYAIEDWGTGYWDSFFDGVQYKRHSRSTDRSALFWLNRVFHRLQRTPFARSTLAARLIGTMKSVPVRGQYHSHDMGMVGFIKELVDECGMGDITHPGLGIDGTRMSKIQEMRISLGHAFVVKA